MDSDIQQLIVRIRDSVIGGQRTFAGPFGRRRLVYADYTASGRSLAFIEDYIRDEVLPLYANTHTEASTTGLQTSRFREDARRIIRQGVGGGDDDVVIFSGSGATGAINKLIQILNLRLPNELDRKYGLSDRIPRDQRPVVFIGPYEHHSNEIPWRESLAEVVVIAEDQDGMIDQAHLEDELNRYQDRPLKIGSFSAASNVTGILSRTDDITRLLHRHGALSFWDFAAAAPYVKIEMNPGLSGGKLAGGGDAADVAKDAVFISPHKFIGGPGTPGVLVVKRKLMTNLVPTVPGGGTVAYVSPSRHTFLADPAVREEGGTPAIIEAIRAGLVFHLKRAVGEQNIESLKDDFVARAVAAWSADPNIEILGNLDSRRLSIVSFVIRHGQRILHHNFVVAVLNDMFGIQARGGCSCAGPYGHRLLGIDLARSMKYHDAIQNGAEGFKPGWVRMSFNYFISEEEFRYLVEAVKLVASVGWRLLPHYRFDADSGIWAHREASDGSCLHLDEIAFTGGEMTYRSPSPDEPARPLPDYLQEARKIMAGESGPGLTRAGTEDPADPLQADLEPLRWFPLPSDMPNE